MILADTDVLIDYLAGVQPVQNQILDYVEADQLQTTAITCFELLSGAGEGKRGQAVRRLVSSLGVLPLDRPAAERAADVRRTLDRAGHPEAARHELVAARVCFDRLGARLDAEAAAAELATVSCAPTT